MLPLLFGALLFAVPQRTATAETGPLGFGQAELTRDMETDRPDFTEGANTVEPGHLQLEAGYTFVADEESGEKFREHTFPELLLRIGLTERIEARVAWTGWSVLRTKDSSNAQSSYTHTDGTTDLELGMKAQIQEQTEAFLNLSILAAVEVPTGANNKSADTIIPNFFLLWSKDVSETWAISGNLGFSSPVDDADERFVEPAASVAISRGLTKKLGAYVEYYGFYPSDSDEQTKHFANGGFTYSVAKNLQFDILAGVGLNSASEDFFTGVGVATRY